MTDLDKLIAAVEAGKPSIGFAISQALERPESSYEVTWARAAYEGSLDAAKRLHDALVPEWTAVELRSRNGRKRWVAELSMMEGDQQIYAVGYNPDPARAWLLAILDALKNGVAKP